MSLDGLTAYVNALFNWAASAATGADFADATFSDSIQFTKALTFGTASSQVNQIWTDTRTVTPATTTDDIDLSGVLTNFHGDVLNFTRVKAIIVYSHATLLGENLEFGGAPHAPWISHLGASTGYGDIIYPGGVLLKTAPLDGFPVTDAAADILRIKHLGSLADITYDIIVLGIG